MTAPLNAATAANLERKSHFVDRVQMHGIGVPLPSWIDLNVTEGCNRSAGHKNACVFCPRIDPALYPNQPKLNMSTGLAMKLAAELHELDYQGTIVLSGYGEPMLHRQLPALISCFGSIRVEIVTNGDFLQIGKIRDLLDAGLDYFAVSLYDGPQQVPRFREMFAAAGADESQYCLRDRWYGPEQDYGLKLTNRGGVLDAGNQQPVDTKHPCYYLAYSMMIDWDGRVLLCCQDWQKRVAFGNLWGQSLISIWLSSAMQKRRMRLIAGRRVDAPCASCNAEGTLHGAAHAAAWIHSGERKA